MFSPRARGCSAGLSGGGLPGSVFPACAGMFRGQDFPRPHPKSFPRVRGDVPQGRNTEKPKPRFSPRARGCSCTVTRTTSTVKVFPACAGMFLAFKLHILQGQGFPRVRGDVPTVQRMLGHASAFSPRARGCSDAACDTAGEGHGFPRVRGDVPSCFLRFAPWVGFSPRARGCSPLTGFCTVSSNVFPACAGMFRMDAGQADW